MVVEVVVAAVVVVGDDHVFQRLSSSISAMSSSSLSSGVSLVGVDIVISDRFDSY